MRIKITQRGWEKYEGDLGTVPFKDGKSIGHIPQREAMALGSYVSVIEIDEDDNELGPVSPSMDMLRMNTVSAEVEPKRMTLKEYRALQEAEAKAAAEAAGEEIKEGPRGPKRWTREELEAIGAEKGISGLREIGDPLGAKNTSIRGLVQEILLRNPNAIV